MTKEEILTNKMDTRYSMPMPVNYEAIYEAMESYAKQQVVAFIKSSIKSYILYATTDETVCVDGHEVDHPSFDKVIAEKYGQFIEQSIK